MNFGQMLQAQATRLALARAQSAPPPATHRHQLRQLSAGRVDRLVDSWSVTETSLNQMIARYGRAVRARSQQFCRDNPYGRRFLKLVRSNVVGHAGFGLAFAPLRGDGSIDEADAALLLRAFNRWAARGQCEVTGRQGFVQLCQLIVAMVAQDGEVLVRRVTGRDRGVHGFQLQLLPAHVLDELHNVDLGGGAKIVMGVELDRFDRPVAYHLREQTMADVYGVTHAKPRVRVPADEITHLFVSEEVGQVRGLPWTATVLRPARHLETFDEAALVAANVGAAKMGFFKSQGGEAGELADATDVNGEFLTSSEPGVFQVLPPGWEIEDYSPDYPHENYDSFTATQLRRIGTGLSASYATISNDRSKENYSSIRTGSLDEREVWMDLQGWLIEDLLRPLITAWLPYAMLYDAELQRLPPAKFDKFNAPAWQGRRWDWVDPAKDVKAETDAVALGIRSRAQIIRARGGDPEQVWKELDAERARGFTAPAAARAPDVETSDQGDER